MIVGIALTESVTTFYSKIELVRLECKTQTLIHSFGLYFCILRAGERERKRVGESANANTYGKLNFHAYMLMNPEGARLQQINEKCDYIAIRIQH